MTEEAEDQDRESVLCQALFLRQATPAFFFDAFLEKPIDGYRVDFQFLGKFLQEGLRRNGDAGTNGDLIAFFVPFLRDIAVRINYLFLRPWPGLVEGVQALLQEARLIQWQVSVPDFCYRPDDFDFFLMLSIIRSMHRLVSIYVMLQLIGCSHQPLEPVAAAPVEGSDQKLVNKLIRVARMKPDVLDADRHRDLLLLAREQQCPCAGVEGTLAECAGAPGCVRGPFALRGIIRALSRKEKLSVIMSRQVERFGPREPETVDVKGAPCAGPASAPVTMVIFSDFECPYCGMAVRLTHAVQKKAGKRLRSCFKHWPLKQHKHARTAAMAAVAAQRQGKFWAMHDLLFAHPKALERSDLLGYASDLELDRRRFEQDLDAAETRAQVVRDVAEAKRLQLTGTPTFLINGRRMTDRKSLDDFMDWIEEAELLTAPASQAGK